jgi:phage terminase large subunit
VGLRLRHLVALPTLRGVAVSVSTLRIETPDVFVPLLQPSRYKGAHGGRGSGKSHVFAEMVIEKCLIEHTRAVCIREVQNSLEQSVKRLLEDKIAQFNVGKMFRVLNTHIEAPHDGVVIFNGMQKHTAESIKSLEGYNVAWVEEAQSLSQRSLDLLRPTIREDNSELWFSWNPRHEDDPVDKLLRMEHPPDAIVVESSYRDNPWFPDVLRQEMEWDRARDVEKYAHIWLGQYERHSEARVFKNWRVEAFDEPPADTAFYYGGDWGYARDPTVLVRTWLKPPKTLCIDYEAYQIGCEIDHTPTLFDTIKNGHARQWVIRADSARPETISYLQRHGYPRVLAARKGPNSVEEGVKFLQSYDIVVHPRCVQTIKEFTMYRWKVDPKVPSRILPIFEDKNNHVIDSVRYATEDLRRPYAKVRELQLG